MGMSGLLPAPASQVGLEGRFHRLPSAKLRVEGCIHEGAADTLAYEGENH